jgi:F1F0 ATPase subunit 2
MIELLITFLGGCLLGTMFYGGLWYTVRHGMTSKIPAVWFLSSFLLRTTIALIGLYYLGAGHWQRILVALAGFIVARFVVTFFTKKGKELSA